jgi:hypothetical protein
VYATQVEREAALPFALGAASAAGDTVGGVKLHVDAGIGLRGRQRESLDEALPSRALGNVALPPRHINGSAGSLKL